MRTLIKSFIYQTKIYGLKYILIHEDQERNRLIRRNKISDNNLPIINLNKISLLFVDYIKIIENAQEIHLIDSSCSQNYQELALT